MEPVCNRSKIFLLRAMPAQILPADDPASLELAHKLLLQGLPVAFPTDTVYGVGALLSDEGTIERLYDIKGREKTKAIAVLVGDPADLGRVTGEMSPSAVRLAQVFWPGALTLVVAASPDLPANLSPLPTVGVRMPDHPQTLALLQRCGPLAVTSANLSGAPSAVSAADVYEQIGALIPLILDGGKTPGGTSSTVVDCTVEPVVILRAGPVSAKQIAEALT